MYHDIKSGTKKFTSVQFSIDCILAKMLPWEHYIQNKTQTQLAKFQVIQAGLQGLLLMWWPLE